MFYYWKHDGYSKPGILMDIIWSLGLGVGQLLESFLGIDLKHDSWLVEN